MNFRGIEIRKDTSVLRDGDVVFAAMLCDLDSCLGPTVRAVWCTPEHYEACSNESTTSSRRAVINVLNNEALNRIAQRALSAHMLDTKLLSIDEVNGHAHATGKRKFSYLLKSYLVPLRSEFEPQRDVTEMLFRSNGSQKHVDDVDETERVERSHVAMCVLVFPVHNSEELCGLALFFDLQRPINSDALDDCLHYDVRTRYSALLRGASQLLSACFELQLKKLVQRSSNDCLSVLDNFLSASCAVYAQCACARDGTNVGAKSRTLCRCSLVDSLLHTLNVCDRQFVEAAIAAHLITRRTVVIGANFDAVHSLLRLLSHITAASSSTVTYGGLQSSRNRSDSESERLGELNGGVWRTALVRNNRSNLLSGLPEGAALIGLQGCVPPDCDVDSEQFVGEELQVDKEFLFAADRPMTIIFVHVTNSRFTGAVHRVFDVLNTFRRVRDAFLNASDSSTTSTNQRYPLRAMHVSTELRKAVNERRLRNDAKFSTAFPFQSHAAGDKSKVPDDCHSVLVDSLLHNLSMLMDSIDFSAASRNCVLECLHAFWTDVHCRALALQHSFDCRSSLLRGVDLQNSTAKKSLQNLLCNLLDIRSENDFHILVTYLTRNDPFALG